MNRKFNQRWSTIQLILTKQAITSHINSQSINKDHDMEVGNPGPAMGQTRQ